MIYQVLALGVTLYSAAVWDNVLIAATTGLECVLRLLLAKGGDPCGKGFLVYEGCTPVFLAAMKGREGCVRMLLEAGAGPDEESTTKLDMGTLQERRAQRNGTQDFRPHERVSVTPLLVAAHEGHEGCVGLLLKAGADPNAEAVPCRGAHRRLRYRFWIWAPEIPNSKTTPQCMGRTAVYMAAQSRHEGVLRLLIEAGGDPNTAVARYPRAHTHTPHAYMETTHARTCARRPSVAQRALSTHNP